MSPPTITIDGPAACGKSTAGRGVARALGFRHLNTGLLYRAVTWASRREGWIDADDFPRRLSELRLDLVREDAGYSVRVDGAEPADELHDPEVTARVSEVSARRPVRQKVNRLLREEAGEAAVVFDGRDMGTDVFPDADLKVYLTAAAEERARRRLGDYGREPTPEAVRRESRRIRARDEADASRELAPLKKPDGAVVIDTTDLRADEVVDRIVREARKRGLTGAQGD